MSPAIQRSELPRAYSDGNGPPSDEAAVRQRIDTLAEAIHNKNLDALMTHYAPDVVVYDLQPPLDVRGINAYRKNFERWFASMSGRINYEMLDLRISANESTAFCHCLSHVTGA